MFSNSPSIFNKTKPLELDIGQLICELTYKPFVRALKNVGKMNEIDGEHGWVAL